MAGARAAQQQAAVAKCGTCSALLCDKCRQAHFEQDECLSHLVRSLDDGAVKQPPLCAQVCALPLSKQ